MLLLHPEFFPVFQWLQDKYGLSWQVVPVYWEEICATQILRNRKSYEGSASNEKDRYK
jgi:predicted 3-demethylubiquinone-9 3-methyltransferase (glyoxalase superfamily)